jgi:hypothetical protein
MHTGTLGESSFAADGQTGGYNSESTSKITTR